MGRQIKRREMIRALAKAGCWVKSDSGAHTKWACPCGHHSANIPRHTDLSPGVVSDTINRMGCLNEGWL